MKKFVFKLSLGMALLTMMLGTVTSSQADQITKIAEASKRVAQLADKLPSTRMGFIEGTSILGAMIEKRSSSSIIFTLDADKTYAFVGGGDDAANDVDILVKDSSGNLVASDTKMDASPVVIFKPRYDGKYTVYLKLDDSDDASSFCMLSALKTGGWTIPVNNLTTTIASSLVLGAVVAERKGANTVLQANGHWSFFGGVARPEATIGLENMFLGSNDCYVCGAGDSNTSDVDLFLRSVSGRSLVVDNDPDATPVVGYSTSSSSRYQITVKNAGSKNALVFALVLQK